MTVALALLVFPFALFAAGRASVKTTPSSPILSPSPNPAELGVATLATASPKPQKQKVINVVDGDTLKLESGEVVRLIGVDAPETNKECYSLEAAKKLEELTLNQEIKLEKDVSETDRYQRLLRYIWVGERLINEILVQEGYAKAYPYPPDVKYKNKLAEAENKAKEEGKGLWGDICKETLKPTPNSDRLRVSATNTPEPQNKQAQTGQTFICNCSKTCSQISSCAEAQYQLNVCGCIARDSDKDGIACDSDCQ